MGHVGFLGIATANLGTQQWQTSKVAHIVAAELGYSKCGPSLTESSIT